MRGSESFSGKSQVKLSQYAIFGTSEDSELEGFTIIYILGAKVRNMKMDFNTGGTWCWVGQ